MPPDAASTPDILTTPEAAAYLKVSLRTMRSLLKDIPHQRLGRGYRIRRLDLDAWFAARTEYPTKGDAS